MQLSHGSKKASIRPDVRSSRVQMVLLALCAALLCFATWRHFEVREAASEVASAPLPTADLPVAEDDSSTPQYPDPTYVDNHQADPPRPIAVVIETTMTDNLIPVMLHFSSVLGPSWTVALFTLEKNWTEPTSVPLRRAIDEGRISIRHLPPDTAFPNSGAVSNFLTRPWLWEQLADAPRVLLFQTDSIICSKSAAAAEDFFAYDFVGAPVAARYGVGYNGGLSLRNPRLMLDVVREASFEADPAAKFEDQWFFARLRDRGGASLPEPDVAKTFSVETIYYDTPLGYHQPQRWQKDRMAEIEAWCPEVKMLVGRRAT